MLVDMKVSQLHTSNSLVSWYFELSIVICPLLLCHSNLNEVNIRFVIIRNQLDNLNLFSDFEGCFEKFSDQVIHSMFSNNFVKEILKAE